VKKFRLLLLDANIVIEISRHGLWDQVTERCEIHLAQTVIDEAQFFDDDAGDRIYIDLRKWVESGDIVIFDRTPSQLSGFQGQFDASYLEKLDPGETESLSYLLDQGTECLLCSADKIVYRVLGALGRPDQGISLDELLAKIGLSRKLTHEFTRNYREEWTKKGFQEGLQGQGLKPKK
jgi:hypothetical protein